MKPKNFPARKLLRRIAVTHRLESVAGYVPEHPVSYDGQLRVARAIRTKKRRAKV